MASGFARFAKANSAHSLGSFVDIASAASSEFEPVDLEDLELAPTTVMAGKEQEVVMGKNATPSASIHSTGDLSREAEDQFDEEDSQGSMRHVADPLHEGLQNLEQATQKAAEAAKDFTSKLWVSGTSEAKSSVMRLAGDVSSWWAALDPAAPTADQDKPQDTARSAQGNEEVQELFSLGPNEELMEKFSCTLIQTVKCTHNSFSQPQQVRSVGKLYITDKHTCFQAEGIQFAIPHKDVKTPSKSGSKGSSLQLTLKKQGEYVCWESFQGSDLDSALGLLEHLTA